MKKTIYTLFILMFFFAFETNAQKTLQEILADYRFEQRIKGPTHKRSKLLEVKIDKHNNYVAMTFSASSYSYIHLYIYRLYTWEAVQELRVKAKRIELYNSTFDADGKFFYANTDVYKNEFHKVDLKTGEIELVPCQEVPDNGCRPLEVRQYETTKFTVGENYVVFQDDKFDNYVRIFVRKELHKIQNQEDAIPDFLLEDEEPEEVPKIDVSLYTLTIDKKQLEELKNYGYLKIKKFDIIVNDELSHSFVFDKLTTSTIVISKQTVDVLDAEQNWSGKDIRITVQK